MTRPGRSRPRRPSRSRCGPSRSSPRRPGSPTRWTRWAARYFVEALTDRMEAEAWRLIRKIDELGGMVRALDVGFPQQEIADSGYRTQLQEDAGERVVVGVNRLRAGGRATDPVSSAGRGASSGTRSRAFARSRRREMPPRSPTSCAGSRTRAGTGRTSCRSSWTRSRRTRRSGRSPTCTARRSGVTGNPSSFDGRRRA